MSKKPAEFPYLGLAVDEDKFITRLWQSFQSSGHLMTRDQIQAVVAIVDKSFAPPIPQPQSV